MLLIPKYIPRKKALLLSGDMVLISIAYFLSPSIRFGIPAFVVGQPSRGWVFILGIYLFTFYLANLYDLDIRLGSLQYLFRFLVAVSIATALVAMVPYFVPLLWFGRGTFLINVVMVGILSYAWRVLFKWLLENILKRPKRLLIIGAGWAGRTLYELVKNSSGFNVVGFIDDDPIKYGTVNSPTVLGDCALLNKMVKTHAVDSVVIAITHHKNVQLLRSILDCKMAGIEVYDMPTFYEELTRKIPVEHVSDSWFVNIPMLGVRRDIYNQKVKRILDLIFSILGILVSLPLAVLTTILIKLDSKGPIFYKQQRVGLNDQAFDLLKFRSMKTNAEENGAVWATKRDGRATRVGKIIRKLRIDEMPQMWNVLKGEMSFIGPRPERPEFVKELKEKIPYYSIRHTIKPGITGWAQVNYSYGASEQDALEKLQYDLFYLKNMSALLDLLVLFRTIPVVLFRKGAY